MNRLYCCCDNVLLWIHARRRSEPPYSTGAAHTTTNTPGGGAWTRLSFTVAENTFHLPSKNNVYRARHRSFSALLYNPIRPTVVWRRTNQPRYRGAVTIADKLTWRSRLSGSMCLCKGKQRTPLLTRTTLYILNCAYWATTTTAPTHS